MCKIINVDFKADKPRRSAFYDALSPRKKLLYTAPCTVIPIEEPFDYRYLERCVMAQKRKTWTTL